MLNPPLTDHQSHSSTEVPPDWALTFLYLCICICAFDTWEFRMFFKWIAYLTHFSTRNPLPGNCVSRQDFHFPACLCLCFYTKPSVICHLYQSLYQAGSLPPDWALTFLLIAAFVFVFVFSLSLSLSFRCLFIIPKPLSGRWAAPRLSSHFSARCFSFGNKLHRPPTILLSYA